MRSLTMVSWTVILVEKFGNKCSNFADSWSSSWLTSKHDDKVFGKFEQTVGKFFGDAEDKGKYSLS